MDFHLCSPFQISVSSWFCFCFFKENGNLIHFIVWHSEPCFLNAGSEIEGKTTGVFIMNAFLFFFKE